MNEWAAGYPLVNVDDSLEREFAERLRESSSLAFRVAFGVLRHREDAEDVAQEAFVRGHRSFAQLRDRDRFCAWLVRMTWRLAIDRLRADKRRTARELAAADEPIASGEQVASERERSRRLWEAIDSLPEKLRITIILAAIEGHDVADVSRLLEIPVGTVKSRLFQARKQLSEMLQCLANTNSSAS